MRIFRLVVGAVFMVVLAGLVPTFGANPLPKIFYLPSSTQTSKAVSVPVEGASPTEQGEQSEQFYILLPPSKDGWKVENPTAEEDRIQVGDPLSTQTSKDVSVPVAGASPTEEGWVQVGKKKKLAKTKNKEKHEQVMLVDIQNCALHTADTGLSWLCTAIDPDLKEDNMSKTSWARELASKAYKSGVMPRSRSESTTSVLFPDAACPNTFFNLRKCDTPREVFHQWYAFVYSLLTEAVVTFYSADLDCAGTQELLHLVYRVSFEEMRDALNWEVNLGSQSKHYGFGRKAKNLGTCNGTPTNFVEIVLLINGKNLEISELRPVLCGEKHTKGCTTYYSPDTLLKTQTYSGKHVSSDGAAPKLNIVQPTPFPSQQDDAGGWTTVNPKKRNW